MLDKQTNVKASSPRKVVPQATLQKYIELAKEQKKYDFVRDSNSEYSESDRESVDSRDERQSEHQLSPRSREQEDKYRGFFNLAIMILAVSHLRLILENMYKYGLLLNVSGYLWEFIEHPYTIHFLLLTASVYLWVVFTYLIEKFATRGYKKGHVSPATEVTVAAMHVISLSSLLFIPMYLTWNLDVQPIAGIMIMVVMTIVWLKMVSYALVNKALRTGSTGMLISWCYLLH
jgi:diacylglycerol O-acyltransferase-1